MNQAKKFPDVPFTHNAFQKAYVFSENARCPLPIHIPPATDQPTDQPTTLPPPYSTHSHPTPRPIPKDYRAKKSIEPKNPKEIVVIIVYIYLSYNFACI